jgi:tryptophan synthase, alpha subunit
MSKLSEAFGHGKAFVAFVTCGDPDMDTTFSVVRELEAAGADVVELGIPFSDPTAEGPVIMDANVRALAAGATIDKVFELVRRLRGEGGVKLPLAFMTYANVVFSYGTELFLVNCADAGVNGLILPDVPFEEKDDFAPACAAHGVDFVSLVAPTSEGRIAMIAREAAGFVYIVSSLGVTGMRSALGGNIGEMVRLIKTNTAVPCAVGFGISTPEQAAAVVGVSDPAPGEVYPDGVIVGSAIVKLIALHGRNAAPVVGEYVRAMKAAITRK